eukprot:UN03532
MNHCAVFDNNTTLCNFSSSSWVIIFQLLNLHSFVLVVQSSFFSFSLSCFDCSTVSSALFFSCSMISNFLQTIHCHHVFFSSSVC